MTSSDPLQPPPLPLVTEQPPPLPSTPVAQSSDASPIDKPTGKPRNTLGIVALVLVLIAAVFTPTGICGIPLLILIPLGLLGAILGLFSLYKAPRWPGLASIGVFLFCLVIWIAMTLGIIVVGAKLAQRIQNEINRELDRTQQRLNQRDNLPPGPPPTPDHIDILSTAAAALSIAAESQRTDEGAAPTMINLSADAGVPTKHQTDPWGNLYRYHRNDSSRGYTFISNGPDGIADTDDDIDILDLRTSIRKRMKH